MTRVLPVRRSLARSLALVATALTLAACGGDGPSEPVDPVAAASGTYNLVSVDDDAVPSLLVASGANRAEITGGTMILNSNGTLMQTIDYRTLVDGVTEEGTEVYSANWSLLGSDGVYIEWDGFEPVEGTISRGVLTFDDIGGTHVYRRR